MAETGPTKAARDRLQAVLAAYGADPSRWPEGDRELGPLLATADPDLAAPLEDARTLDSALSRASRPVVPAGAAGRLAAKVDGVQNAVVTFSQSAEAQQHRRRAALPGRLAVLTALAASLAFGMYLGASGQVDWLTSPLLAEESPVYVTAELDVLDGTMQLFEEHTEP